MNAENQQKNISVNRRKKISVNQREKISANQRAKRLLADSRKLISLINAENQKKISVN
jgi:hypothetical protein